MQAKPRAIMSVYDKRGLAEFGRELARLGWELIASGGTAGALRAAGLEPLDVSAVTGAAEMLAGRVKTLHPAVHAGILARATAADSAELAAQGVAPIDLVVCNLYPFQATAARPGVSPAEAVEQIDIGGVALLRAGAKNFERVTAVCDPADYPAVLAELAEGGATRPEMRRRLAAKAFAHTRDYDMAIAGYLNGQNQAEAAPEGALPARLELDLRLAQPLRYGENPHQAAGLYAADPAAGPLGGQLLQGKPLSYNNLLDLDAAWRAAESFSRPAVIIVKHLSPCGMALGERPAAAFPLALASDPVSAFGGVMAANRPLELDFCQALAAAELFVEAVVAPGFSPEAAEWFGRHKKNCRLLALAEPAPAGLELRSVRAGYLAQTPDQGDPAEAEWRVAGRREPSPAEWRALRFAWRAGQHVKSNAIVLAAGEATVGIGGGLPSRVDAVRLAAAKAGPRAQGAVLASDAFFPFADGVEAAAAAGVTAVVEPGGSVRDDEVIAAADRLGLALVFTGARHFRH
ncbi:MAG: bifunctional phosphoribosylaminoimidazolecarboxamide formyltransferase/IMP cyclohydrolase [Candidatus Promineifilaceae bacterium]